jgi:hypothetical protein
MTQATVTLMKILLVELDMSRPQVLALPHML